MQRPETLPHSSQQSKTTGLMSRRAFERPLQNALGDVRLCLGLQSSPRPLDIHARPPSTILDDRLCLGPPRPRYLCPIGSPTINNPRRQTSSWSAIFLLALDIYARTARPPSTTPLTTSRGTARKPALELSCSAILCFSAAATTGACSSSQVEYDREE